jgi:hypothetical protein
VFTQAQQRARSSDVAGRSQKGQFHIHVILPV